MRGKRGQVGFSLVSRAAMPNTRVLAPQSGGYIVLQWEKTARTFHGAGGWKGVGHTFSRASRYRTFKKLALRDWGHSPVMVTLTSRRILHATTASAFARTTTKAAKKAGIGCAIRLEFQRRQSAHLHILLPTGVPPEFAASIGTRWLAHIGEADDPDTARYGVNVTQVTAADSRFLLLYAAGHTSKGDYQSTAPYPVRQWVWFHLDPIPLLADTGLVIDSSELQLICAKHRKEDRPLSWGGTLVLDPAELSAL